MIRPNELRIGNYLENLLDEKWVLVSTNWNELWQLSTDPESFNEEHRAIPITPEILERCGFYHALTKSGQTYYKHEENGFTVLYSYGKWGWSLSPSITHGKPIEYLHQLQNLYFSLCGEELQYNP